jgi:Zn-dependent M28 family amino/carboxypeptidase
LVHEIGSGKIPIMKGESDSGQSSQVGRSSLRSRTKSGGNQLTARIPTLKKNGDIKKLALAINMDMVGYNSNGIVELETDSQYEKLANWFAGLATTYTSLKSKITIGAWGSDHVPFIQGGVPTLLTIEDWSTKTPCYHTECDKPSTLNYEYAGQIAKLNLAAIMTKDAE